MAQCARENPELAEQGIGYLGARTDLADWDDTPLRKRTTARVCSRCGQVIQGSTRHTLLGSFHFPNCPEVG